MDNPFSYPSLAFGSESFQLGAELNRYNAFQADNYWSESDGEPEEDPVEDPRNPVGPAASDEIPPEGGSGVSDRHVQYLAYAGIAAITLYFGYLWDKGELTSDILFPTFGS